MPYQKTVLVIDDEEDILRLLKTVLEKEGIDRVETAATAAEGLSRFQTVQPDLIILDIMLPDGEGYDVCSQIRKESNVPILFLSAKSEETDKIVGFALGGDDYITKPFSPKEVAYRVKAQLRRADFSQEKTKKEIIVEAGPFVFDEAKAEVTKNGRVIDLNPKELGLMKLFLQNPQRVISKEQLYDSVWGEDFLGSDNTVMVHIRRLREKVETDPSSPRHILTVKGLGYKFIAGDEQK